MTTSSHSINICWQLAKAQLLELDFRARVVDIDAHQLAFGIVIENHSLGNL